MSEDEGSKRHKAGFVATMKAVFWSFFGVRRKSDYERDASSLNPVHVILAGVLAAVLSVVILVLVVKAVVANA